MKVQLFFSDKVVHVSLMTHLNCGNLAINEKSAQDMI